MQCDYVGAAGQCGADAEFGRFCSTHAPGAKQHIVGQYRLACRQLGDTPERIAAHENLKSVRDELVLIKTLIERRLNLVDTDADLISAIPQIRELALTVDKLATNCHNMDVKLHKTLNKAALVSLAHRWIGDINSTLRPLVDQTVTAQHVDEVIEILGRLIIRAIAEQENT